MNNKSFKLIKHLGMLSAPGGDAVKTVSIVQWGELEPSLDIRKWENNEPKKGISIRGDEIVRSRELLSSLNRGTIKVVNGGCCSGRTVAVLLRTSSCRLPYAPFDRASIYVV